MQSQPPTDTDTGILVRPARPDDDDDAARLLLPCSPARYVFLAGGEARALGFVLAAMPRRGNDMSREAIYVAEIDGRVAGAISVFPADERHLRRRRLLLLALTRRPPWHWPRLIRGSLASLKPQPGLPPRALLIEALATDERFRRRGVARALLGTAVDQCRSSGLEGITVSTHEANEPARALYERVGMQPVEPRPPGSALYHLTISAAG
jgi:GNAT superfamily N-acetyltransferase